MCPLTTINIATCLHYNKFKPCHNVQYIFSQPVSLIYVVSIHYTASYSSPQTSGPSQLSEIFGIMRCIKKTVSNVNQF